MEDISIGLIVGIVFVYLLIIAGGLASYIMSSYALYTIAGNRNIENAWLAWLPIGVSWIIGSIADEYDARNGIKRKWRTILLVLSILSVVIYFFLFAFMIIMSLTTLRNFTSETADVTSVLMVFLPIYIVYFVAIFTMIVYGVLSCVCNFKIYESTVPDKAILYTILGLTVPMAQPICLLACRNKFSPYTKIPYFSLVEESEKANVSEADNTDTEIVE